MNGYERIIAALEVREPDQVPIFEILVHKNVYEAICPQAKSPADFEEMMDFDGVCCFRDFRVVEEMGEYYTDEWGVTYKRRSVEDFNHPVKGPLESIDDLRTYSPPEPDAPWRLSNLPELVDRFRRKKAVIFHARAAFMDSAYLIGLDKTLMNFLLDPEFVAAVMDMVVEFNMGVIRNAIHAGADVISLGEEVQMEPSPATKLRFAYVGGHISLYDWLTLQEHLDFIGGFYPSWDQEWCRELQHVFRLPMHQKVGTLSLGLHVQFQLLMALARRPELLIMDEPGNLDPVVRTRLMSTMIEILEADEATIVMASHLIDELEGICDHICIIDQGLTLTAGPVEELVADVREIHFPGVSADQMPTVEGIWHQQISGRELRVVMAGYTEEKAEKLARQLKADSYEVGRVSLQEFFIALTAERD